MSHRLARLIAAAATAAATIAAPVIASAEPTSSSIDLPGLTVGSTDDSCAPVRGFVLPGGLSTSTTTPGSTIGTSAGIGDAFRSIGLPTSVINYNAAPFLDQAYTTTENQAVAAAEARIAGFLNRCPESRAVIGGYSLGAGAAAKIAHRAGHGISAIPADRLAAAVGWSSPYRGTAGAENHGSAGAGTGLLGELPGGYEAMSGKVADICIAGDLVCDGGARPGLVHISPSIAAAGGLASGVDVDRIAGSSAGMDPLQLLGLTGEVAEGATVGTWRHMMSYNNPAMQGEGAGFVASRL